MGQIKSSVETMDFIVYFVGIFVIPQLHQCWSSWTAAYF